jgi:hypothetical protein
VTSRAAVILVWLTVTGVYAWWFIVTAAAPVGYVLADNALMTFVMMRLPFFVVGLGLALWLVGRWRRA